MVAISILNVSTGAALLEARAVHAQSYESCVDDRNTSYQGQRREVQLLPPPIYSWKIKRCQLVQLHY